MCVAPRALNRDSVHLTLALLPPLGPNFYNVFNQKTLNPDEAGVELDDPNRWQRLELLNFVDQSGIASDGYPPFTGPQWGFVRPFALQVVDRSEQERFDGVYFDQGAPPRAVVDGPVDRLADHWTVGGMGLGVEDP